tara:strand:- start:1484 stop:2902 length:1419 start_codon:yes stop_codon:yes gene_type:complete
MATEIDKTIEELEAEVLAELEEANGADAPKKSAVKAEPMDKIKPALAGEDKPEDMGKAVVDPKDASDPGKAASKKAKEVSGDAQQSKETKPDAMQKIKEEEDEDKEDDKEMMKAQKKKMMAQKDKEMKEEEDDEESDKDSEDEKEEEMTDEQMKKEMHKAMKSMKKEDMKNMYAQYMKDMNGKTKDEMYQEMSKGMEQMKKEQMKKLHAQMMPSKMKEEADEKTEQRLKSVDVKEHVDALLNSDDSLSKEFKEKAATIFETAVKSKIREEIKRLEEEYQEDVRTEIAETRESLTSKVDSYLDYVTSEWMKENELAIERGLKGEIAEDFISGLKQLFEDHYIDVPAEKYDVLEAQADKISKLEKKLEETTQQVVEARRSEGSLMKESVKAEVSSDLTETEIEKFDSLAQEVEYTDKESYTEKLKTIKENYFPKKALSETAHDEVETGTAVQADIDGPMGAYISAIGKAVKSAN